MLPSLELLSWGMTFAFSYGFIVRENSICDSPHFLIIPIWHFSPQQTKERFLTLKSSIEVLAEDTSNLSDQERVSAGSMASRWELIKRGLIAFTENPFLGLGLHCFNSFNGRRWGYWFPPHNTYVQALSEMGIIGFAAFLSVIIFTVGNLRKSREILRKMEERVPLFDIALPRSYIFTLSSGYVWARSL
jgi:O-antigen ligase